MHEVKTRPLQMGFALEPIYEGTLQNAAPTQQQVELENSAAGGGTKANDFFNGWAWIYFTSGPCRGEFKRIIDFVNATQVAVLESGLTAVPGLDTYKIYTVLTGDFLLLTATAGDAESITLPLAAGIRDDFWNQCWIDLVGGTGGNIHRPHQKRRIVDYDGATQKAFIEKNWETDPAAGTIARVHGHLAHHVNEIKVVEASSAAIFVGHNPGDIAYGIDSVGEFDSGDEPSLIKYLELAIDAAAPGNIQILRWEV